MFTHTIEININGLSPKVTLQAEVNIETGEFNVTAMPSIVKISFLDVLTDFFHTISKIHNKIGNIERIEVNKIV